MYPAIKTDRLSSSEIEHFSFFVRGHSGLKNCVALSDVVVEFLRSPNQELVMMFPNIFLVYQIAASLAVSTAGVERSFSSMKYLKNRLRSTMSDDRLEEDLVLIYLHNDITIPVDEIIDRFKALGHGKFAL